MTFAKHALAVAIFFGVTGAAQAGLNICNKTSHTQGISIGYKDGNNWVSEGWASATAISPPWASAVC
jgi:uncharacterized membrane protein